MLWGKHNWFYCRENRSKHASSELVPTMALTKHKVLSFNFVVAFIYCVLTIVFAACFFLSSAPQAYAQGTGIQGDTLIGKELVFGDDVTIANNDSDTSANYALIVNYDKNGDKKYHLVFEYFSENSGKNPPTTADTYRGYNVVAVYKIENFFDVKGSNNRTDYRNSPPWLKYRDNIVQVDINNKLKLENHFDELKYFFYNFIHLTTITGMANLDTSIATTLEGMFYGCRSLTSLDFSSFKTDSDSKTSAVKNMSYMFYGCSSLKNLVLTNFDTRNVTNMSYMFSWCNFSSLITKNSAQTKDGESYLNISSFDTSNVATMSGMFGHCENLTLANLSGHNLGNVIDTSKMFAYCYSLENVDLTKTSIDVTTSKDGSNISQMFFKDGNLSSVNIENFTNMGCYNVASARNIFDGCNSLQANYALLVDYEDNNNGEGYHLVFTYIPSCCKNKDGELDVYKYCNRPIKDSWLIEDIPTITKKNSPERAPWFNNNEQAKKIKQVKIDNKFGSTSTDWWFFALNNLEKIEGLNKLDTSKVKSMKAMFDGCSSLTSLDLSSFNTSKVENMLYMFSGCSSLTSLDLSSFDTSKVKDMFYMFCGCSSLTSLDLSSFNTSEVEDMQGMFYSCEKLEELNLPGFITNKVTHSECMFKGDTNLKTIYASDWYTVYDIKNIFIDDWGVVNGLDDMFDGCKSLVGGKGTTYDEKRTYGTYAHVDGGKNNPGYFSKKN